MTIFVFFFFNDTATTEIYTLSLHDALPILIILGVDVFEDDEAYRELTGSPGKGKPDVEGRTYAIQTL